MRAGMARVIPLPLLSLLTAHQLEVLVCGSPVFSLDLLVRPPSRASLACVFWVAGLSMCVCVCVCVWGGGDAQTGV